VERIPAWVAAAALVFVACTGLLGANRQPATAAAPGDALPDLVADPPANPRLDNYAYSNRTHDLLLRFDGSVHNAGAGAFEIHGSRASASVPMAPLQRVYRTDGTSHDDSMPNAQLLYSNADGHHHWHLQDVARYSLWTGDKTAEVAPAMKVGFCLGDTEHVNTAVGPSSPYYDDPHGEQFCQRNAPDALSLFEGVSAGWRDVYDRTLALQWVVVSDVQPGSYWLREDIDPDRIVHESDEANAPAWSASAVTIPGYMARPVEVPPGSYGKAQQVTLGADAFGSPGERRFRIVTPPAHGTLDVGAGTDLSDPSVTYTPASGYSGPDQFTYQAADATSSYPLHPATATVSLSVAAPPAARVVIDTAPTSVQVADGAQLHATVTNDFPGVTWSVNGVDGGGAGAGRITPAGFYTAPASVPAPGHVTIAARSASGAHDERVVKIIARPPPGKSPGVHCSGPRKGHRLGSIAAAFAENVLAACVIPRRAGVVSIVASAGGRRLGSCRGKDPKGRQFTCRVYVPHGMKLAKLTLVAKLERGGRVVATVRRYGAP
jgi:hypothetical protein